MAATRGAPTDAVSAAMHDRVMVAMPAASISRWTSPTDQWQTGQTGTSSAASTSSRRILSTIAGTVFRSSSSGRSR